MASITGTRYSFRSRLVKYISKNIRPLRLRCKNYFEARKVVWSISLCCDLKEVQDELRLRLRIASG